MSVQIFDVSPADDQQMQFQAVLKVCHSSVSVTQSVENTQLHLTTVLSDFFKTTVIAHQTLIFYLRIYQNSLVTAICAAQTA